jgi:hypothetical protein
VAGFDQNGAIYPVDFRRDFDPDEITASPLFRPTDDATGLNTDKNDKIKSAFLALPHPPFPLHNNT